MDGERFDRLARALAGGVSRRRLVRSLGAAGGLLAVLGPRPAAAACAYVGDRCRPNWPCCPGARCRDDRCTCRKGLTSCFEPYGVCFDLRNDRNHCGRCRRRCAGGDSCRRGECVPPEPGSVPSVPREGGCNATIDCNQEGGPVVCARPSEACGGAGGQCGEDECESRCGGTDDGSGNQATCPLDHCDCAEGTSCIEGRCQRT